METFKILIVILLSSVLVDNYVLNRFLGICPFLGVSKKLDQATGMGIAVTVVMLIATAVTWPIQYFVLNTLHLEYLQNIAFILTIATLVQILEVVLKKFSPSLYKGLGVYLPLITTNCAVLGITMLNFTSERVNSYHEALFNALGAGLGFLFAMFIFSGVRTRLETSNIPESLKGLPITLVSAAIVSLSFLGFAGIVG